MTILNNAFTALAAVGLLVSQTAAAAPASGTRAAAGIEQSEGLGGPSASAPFLAAFAVFLAVGIFLLVDDDDDEGPVSP